VAVSHQTSLVAALAAIDQVLKANPRVLQEPAPFVRVVRVEGPAIVIGVAPWVQVPDYGKAMGELHEAIIEAFRARDISGPVPQRDVRLLSSAAYLPGQGAQERLAGRDAA
jgi:small conductance mechanosensitive channel